MERFATSWAAVALEEGAPSPPLLGRLVPALFFLLVQQGDFTVTLFGVRGRYRSKTERVVEGRGGGRKTKPKQRTFLSVSLSVFALPPLCFSSRVELGRNICCILK